VLADQFTAGLLPTLRSTVAGVKGNSERLLVKARFEEAKVGDLSGCSGDSSSRQFTNQILSFLQVFTRNLTTGPFMALAI